MAWWARVLHGCSLRLAAAAIVAGPLLGAVATATPLTVINFGTRPPTLIKPPLKWADGTTLNVWIQKVDPDGPDSRQRLFADGIQRWPTRTSSRAASPSA